MSVIKVYRYHRPVWLPVILTGSLSILIAAYVLLPAQSVNAAGPGGGISLAQAPAGTGRQTPEAAPRETDPEHLRAGDTLAAPQTPEAAPRETPPWETTHGKTAPAGQADQADQAGESRSPRTPAPLAGEAPLAQLFGEVPETPRTEQAEAAVPGANHRRMAPPGAARTETASQEQERGRDKPAPAPGLAPPGVDGTVEFDRRRDKPAPAPRLAPQPPEAAEDIALLRRDLVRLSREMQSLQDTVRQALTGPTRPEHKTAHGAQARPAGAAPARRAQQPSQQPSGPLHRVRAGDTLGAIAARHGLPLACLLHWNGLRRTDVIHPGQGLHLSGDTPCASPRMQTRQRAGPKPRRRAAPDDPGPALEHWVILGMNTRQAALLSPDQQVHLFAIGEIVPGAGRIIRLDSRRKLVTTRRGVIHSLGR